MLNLLTLLVLASTLWMAFDTRGRDFSASRFANRRWQWIVGGLGLWIVAFPAYLFARERYPRRDVSTF
jgi:hypothetical protein